MTKKLLGPQEDPGVTKQSLPKRRHLRRLERLAADLAPVFFITVCTKNRLPHLRNPQAAHIIIDALNGAESTYDWVVGRFVVMPDHVHFFCAPAAQDARSLSSFVGYWKRGAVVRIRRLCQPAFGWQAEFFDHLLRSDESYAGKWEYVRANPVRAGLVKRAEEWPFQGEVSILQR
jgi:REP element-mobilizing transposase RayT